MNFLWLIKTESFKRGMVLSVIFNIIAKGILFLLIIFIARLFGSNIKTDIYFFVYTTMILLSGFISAIDTSVLIPQSMHLREKQGNEAAISFLNFFFRIYILIGLLVVIITFFFGTKIFGLVSKFAATDILLYKNYFLAGALYFFFMILTNYINAILTSLKYFTIPMIISGINSCVVIAGIFLLHARFDVLSIFLGGIAAYSFNLVLLTGILKKKAGWNYFIKTAPVSKQTRGNIFFTTLGQLATFASSFLPLFLLSGFGNGVISIMNYGKNIADIPNTLITSQLTSVSGVQLNEQAANADTGNMNTTFIKSARGLIFVLIPVAAFVFVFSEPIVEIVYNRGAFTVDGIKTAAMYLQYFSIVIFPIGINAMVTRVFISIQLIKQSLTYQLYMNAILIIAIIIFVKYYNGLGYPLGVMVINTINLGTLFFLCKKFVPFINYSMILKYSLLIIAVNVPIIATVYGIVIYTGLSNILQLLIAAILYAILLLTVNWFLKLNNDFIDLLAGLKNKFV